MSDIENPVVLTKQGRVMGKTKVGVQLFARFHTLHHLLASFVSRRRSPWTHGMISTTARGLVLPRRKLLVVG